LASFWLRPVLSASVKKPHEPYSRELVFTELAKGPADLASLSRRLGLHDRSARDFLDALVALKILDRKDGRYSNMADTDLFPLFDRRVDARVPLA
jgi:predicted ArsR family transcriptional regulator